MSSGSMQLLPEQGDQAQPTIGMHFGLEHPRATCHAMNHDDRRDTFVRDDSECLPFLLEYPSAANGVR